jgi:hypothetical protein
MITQLGGCVDHLTSLDLSQHPIWVLDQCVFRSGSLGAKPMTPNQASRLAAHSRKLRATKILTVHECAVFDTMLWRLRGPGLSAFMATYKAIARLTGVCRDTAIQAVKKLVSLGLIQKERQRVRVRHGTSRLTMVSRQIANAYRIIAPVTESVTYPADNGLIRLPSESVRTRGSDRFEAALKGFGITTGLLM